MTQPRAKSGDGVVRPRRIEQADTIKSFILFLFDEPEL